MSRYTNLTEAESIEVLEVCTAFSKDANTFKANLSIGASTDETGKVYLFNVVRKVEQQLASDPELHHGYLPTLGLDEVNNAALALLLGKDNPVINEGRAFCVHSVGGTGPFRIAAELLFRELGYTDAMYSDPTWMNHRDIFKRAGFTNVTPYPYWSPTSMDFDFKAMVSCLKKAKENTVVVLHASAHNPTGMDPTREQWKTICSVIKDKKLLPFFDCAYQGFATGNLEADSWPIRHFVEQGMEILVSQSFGKNMCLYGERVGFLVGTVSNKSTVPRIESQLTSIARAMYSKPAGHGANIVGTILTSPKLFKEWTDELQALVAKVRSMRTTMKKILDQLAPERDWTSLTAQIGMFFYSGLSPEQGEALRSRHHVYILPSSGRINLGAVTHKNVEYVAKSIAHVVKNF